MSKGDLIAKQTYAIRRIKDAFRENKNIKDSTEIETLVNKAKTNLEIIRRQVWSFISIYIKDGSPAVLQMSLDYNFHQHNH
ncbi:LYR motif-containing protein 4 isoform X1 [Sceloporus undulatus]|uniref:LYR motif-containing protein 4 isoform X1 n=1 Tax=Sceloporus undulatus TaxID=8520 RepID=UPI001C4D278C|nr:LYR motif-containing protein 4 isoform X1 [Sceloporus undulatus]